MYVATPPDITELLREPQGHLPLLLALGQSSVPPGYPHWDKLRHLDPPVGVSQEMWWTGIRLARQLRPISLRAADGSSFFYGLPDEVLRLLHFVDQRCAGEVEMSEVVTDDEQARQRYLVSSLMEEAIRSSQLEGASTSRHVAKELLRSGREPRDRGEQMILNNYRALAFIRDAASDRLTPSLVLELQRILTDGTLDDPDAAGRLQRPDEERVVVVDVDSGTVLHEPPPADELPERLQALCDFANAPDDGTPFIHPVVRAILLHFWLAYDHPFVDGNGRTARALFYWYLRKRRYRLIEYLSISRILRAAPRKYTRAFLYTETDGGDTTYFLLHQLQVIEQAVHEFHEYLARKIAEIRDVELLLADDGRFNHRQLALLGEALRHPDRTYTLNAHATEHRVTHETARSDVGALVDHGLLERHRRGQGYRFTVPRDFQERLRRVGAAA
jgi:Fic family protein